MRRWIEILNSAPKSEEHLTYPKGHVILISSQGNKVMKNSVLDGNTFTMKKPPMPIWRRGFGRTVRFVRNAAVSSASARCRARAPALAFTSATSAVSRSAYCRDRVRVVPCAAAVVAPMRAPDGVEQERHYSKLASPTLGVTLKTAWFMYASRTRGDEGTRHGAYGWRRQDRRNRRNYHGPHGRHA